ncbi:methionyl-tRNA formyltransferase [Mesonia sp. MT50]|uniref:Methionyl-tRNA formyltransferase n=1 Tax=Mesonia profundi TaxID=3070998 RepID=A0ABU1A096_9FLAO|nr:methionyl-tRNA formyltransferase [Mesonia profundi]MDQ7917117.1 methionyl-tRNA formyltransferase [Mesonia profundi]
MTALRILFMGTPEFAVTILDQIIQQDYTVVGVVTAPDKPAGRGQKLRKSAVKVFAEEKGIEVLQPTNLKSDAFQEDLNRLQPNLNIVVAFRMLPKKVWNFPSLGTFNLHASLLPQYRGAAPINWAIINGEKTTGVTTFFIDEKIDTGSVILREEVEIEATDNAGSLHDKLMHKGASLVITTLEQIENDKVSPQEQKEAGGLKTAYKLINENTKIDWSKPTQEIYNHIRGLSPYPVAWTQLENGEETLRCKIQEASYTLKEHQLPLGKISMEEKSILVATQNGFIKIEQMQLPGKRKMKAKDLLNGYEFKENAKML